MKVKAYVHAKYDDHYDAESGKYIKGFRYVAWPCKGDSWGFFVCEHEFEIPAVDENELRNGVVKLMRDEQQKIRADAEVKFQNIEQQIQEMLCLPAEVPA